jgi:small subunit ribosomal protein S5
MGLISQSSDAYLGTGLKPYQENEKAALSKKYTREQLQVIEEGEAAINPKDVSLQGRFRTDPYRLRYLDDLSFIRPIIDQRIKTKSTISDNARILDSEEEEHEIAKWFTKQMIENEDMQAEKIMENGTTVGGKRVVPQTREEALKIYKDKLAAEIDSGVDDGGDFKPSRLDFMKFIEESTSMSGGGKRGSGTIAPALPKIESIEEAYKREDEFSIKDPDGKYAVLRKQTGMTIDEILDARVKILVNHRVVNQTRLGKISSMYVLAIAGNGNGQLGIGEGKATEPDEAIDKARKAAIRAMKPIPRYEERTIYGDVEGKVSASIVKLMGRPPGKMPNLFLPQLKLTLAGFGVRCQSLIFEMARAAGIHDLAARVPRSRNKMNTIKATYQALMSQRLPDDVARGRGKKLVDVRKVYYGGDQKYPRNTNRGDRETNAWGNV